jgi:hypothetical protein
MPQNRPSTDFNQLFLGFCAAAHSGSLTPANNDDGNNIHNVLKKRSFRLINVFFDVTVNVSEVLVP